MDLGATLCTASYAPHSTSTAACAVLPPPKRGVGGLFVALP